jgi:hypothetical protein
MRDMEPPFQTPSGLVFTSREVLYEDWPVLLVTHDESHEAWQFVNGHGDTEEGAKPLLVHAEHIVERDSSILELADLPLGWMAWRPTAEDEWRREPAAE